MTTQPNTPTPPPAPVRERHKYQPLIDEYARRVAKLRRAREVDYTNYVQRSIDRTARRNRRFG